MKNSRCVLLGLIPATLAVVGLAASRVDAQEKRSAKVSVRIVDQKDDLAVPYLYLHLYRDGTLADTRQRHTRRDDDNLARAIIKSAEEGSKICNVVLVLDKSCETTVSVLGAALERIEKACSPEMETRIHVVIPRSERVKP